MGSGCKPEPARGVGRGFSLAIPLIPKLQLGNGKTLRHGKMTHKIRKGAIMANTSIKENLIDQIEKLPYDLQLRVLNFAKALIPKGVEGKRLLPY